METHYRLVASGLTDTGLRRTSNEDSFFTHCESGFFLVADGMGGAAAGEIASKIFRDVACKTIPLRLQRTEKEAVTLIKKIFLEANVKIREHILDNPDHDGMGCTAELLLFHDHGYAIGHIGDSRTYRLRHDHFNRLTRDHSLIQEQVESGIISRNEARTHRLRNVIFKAVGVNEQLEIDIIRGRFVRGDFFMLCSDGLSDMISDKDIENILCGKGPLKDLTDQLVTKAKHAGGRDNITVVLVEVKA